MWLGAEATELGSAGVAVVAEATGVAADTVRRGHKEADAGIHPGAGRSRRAGGGTANEPRSTTRCWWRRSSR
ncbi:hypothetical protein GFS60_07463 (plasmid) [Rhodococcus sp. WAY2]|nr:hypothetical protein GFS60_07463 [Rhodococcus sp. WAY2]